MCTVTYVNTGKQKIITSNRDEKITRPNSTLPEVLKIGALEIYYSRDVQAKGTWLVADNEGRVAVLLNGAFEMHIPKSSYKKSRGIVLLELFSSPNFKDAFQEYDLTDIEPFQILFLGKDELYRFVWDGEEKSQLLLDENDAYIFSSVTLYNATIRKERELIFDTFLKQQIEVNADSLFELHTTLPSLENQNGFLLNREGEAKTYSVSQVSMGSTLSTYKYYDISKQQLTLRKIFING